MLPMQMIADGALADCDAQLEAAYESCEGDECNDASKAYDECKNAKERERANRIDGYGENQRGDTSGASDRDNDEAIDNSDRNNTDKDKGQNI